MVEWLPLVEATKLADGAVQTRVLADESVDTAKIARLAVTDAVIANATITKLKIGDQEVDIQRMLDPVGGFTDGDFESNVSLTTTTTSHNTITITVPEWAGEARIWAQSFCQMSNSSGGAQQLQVRCVIDGFPSSGVTTQHIADGTTGQGNDWEMRHASAPGSTIDCETYVGLSSGTNSSNVIFIRFFAMFFR